MSRPTTWELMERYNLPVPGSQIRILSFLGSYVTVGKVYRVGWGRDSFDAYLSSEGGGTGVRISNFERCEWEYVYDGFEKPHLKWPRATLALAAPEDK